MSTRRKGAEQEYKTEEVTGNGHRDGDEHIENEPRKKSRGICKSRGCEIPVPVEAEIVSLDEFSTSPSNEQSPIEKQGPVGWNSYSSQNLSSRRRIRVVKPYPFTFSTFAKARWIGRSLLDVYHNEFGSYPRSYYESAIKEGRILVSGRQVSCDYKVKNADKLCHTVHRHEPAVSLCDYYHENELKSIPWIKVLYEDSKIIVVDKPATLPIHPCGAYYYNSLFHILSAQRPDLHGTLHTVHRLDRLTSGLTLIAKTPNIASSLTKSIMTRVDCQKMYLARVKGCFPLNASSTHICLKDKAVNGTGVWISNDREKQKQEATYTNVFHSRMKLTSSIIQDASTEKLSTTSQGLVDGEVLWLHLSCPCDVEDPKNGVCKAGKGKPAETAFSVVHYDKDSDTTIVMAKPITGRTHQIRLHLQFLNHPIANDPCYGGDMWYGNPSGESLCSKARESMKYMDDVTLQTDKPDDALSFQVPATEEEIAAMAMFHRHENETLFDFITRSCVWCARSQGGDRSKLEYLVRSPGIWLHAYQYTFNIPGDGLQTFSTDIPCWCIFDYQEKTLDILSCFSSSLSESQYCTNNA